MAPIKEINRARPKRLVIIESPLAGETEAIVKRNLGYARACVRNSLQQGEAPFASHLLYTQPGIYRDDRPNERALGIAAGHAWLAVADCCAVYQDLGISVGMKQGIEAAIAAGVSVEYRNIITG